MDYCRLIKRYQLTPCQLVYLSTFKCQCGQRKLDIKWMHSSRVSLGEIHWIFNYKWSIIQYKCILMFPQKYLACKHSRGLNHRPLGDVVVIWNMLISNMTSEFPHLAIAVSPRLEVKSSGHAWLDGCNFQRKRLLAPTGYSHRHPANENIDDVGNLHDYWIAAL